MPISREPRCRAEDACRSAYRRRAGDRRVDGDLPARAAGREPSAGLAAVYRAAAATGEALGERHRGVLDAACRRTPPRIPARAERHAISGSPRVCRWTETLSRRYNSPPPHRNWQAHENAVASVATVLAMTPTEAAATATPVRVHCHRRILRNDTNGLPARGRRRVLFPEPQAETAPLTVSSGKSRNSHDRRSIHNRAPTGDAGRYIGRSGSQTGEMG